MITEPGPPGFLEPQYEDGMLVQPARGLRLRVVAAKYPGRYIVRAIAAFKTAEYAKNLVLNFVGRIDLGDLEWTTYEYFIPSYIAYSSDSDINGLTAWPIGVFIHRYKGDGTYGKAERLA
jgi:hypothetical protein